MTEKHITISSIILKTVLSFFITLAIVILLPMHIHAKDLDEIQVYSIHVDVNEDATLDMYYHIRWKVLIRQPTVRLHG